MTRVTALAMWSGCVAVAALSAQAIQPPPIAFMTFERVVYGYDQPVDLTFSIAVPEGGSVVPRFAIVNEAGETVAARDVDGRYFWETPGEAIDGTQRPGSIPAGRRHTETIDDLRQWYELDEPGMYQVTFDGQRSPEAKAVTSNTLLIRIARPPSEEEPHGEPTEGRVIPLSDIWALGMPGTKPMIRVIAKDGISHVAPEGPFVQDILDALNSAERRHVSESGFAVRGEGMAALREVHSIIVGGQAPPTHFSAGERISLVFHSKHFGSYIHLDRVEVHEAIVDLSYRVVGHHDRYVTSHLALVPVTLEDTDDLWVAIRMSGLGDAVPSTIDRLSRTVVRPFSISIER